MRGVILLSILVGLMTPGLSQAELWRCPRPDGTDLYTDRLRDPATCQKYEPVASLGYVSGRASGASVPPPVVQRGLPPPEEVPPPEARLPRPARDPYYPPGDDSAYFDDTGYYDESYPGYYDDSLGYYPGGVLLSNRRFLRPKPKTRMHAIPAPGPPSSPAGAVPEKPAEKANPAPVSPSFHRR